ncbi:hypothetical protein DJ84_21240 [Halorubrum ezzemoulense]|nr:hypothetical protein DJ84_21240 [Halorubrum ezzemoulense]
MIKNKKVTDPRIHDIVGEIDGGHVLDIGCVQHDSSKRHDPNWLHQHLYDPADSVFGVDRDADGVQNLRQAGYNVVTGDAEVLDLDDTYDYVVAGELIENLSNPGEFLKAAKDVLSENGRLVLTMTNIWCWARLKHITQKDGVPYNPEHTHYHDEATLRQLLERYGYRVNIKYVAPMSEGITRWLNRMPIRQFKRLGSTRLLVIAGVNE